MLNLFSLGGPSCVVANVLDCDVVENKFDLQ